MIKIFVDGNVLYVKVLGEIQQGDFEEHARKAADQIIDEYGKIRGILIDANEFEGWEDFPALFEHISFVKDTNEDVYRVAIIGDQTWQKLLPPIASLFVEPVIKRFDPGQEEEAEAWIKKW